MWLLTNCKNGISSYELHRALGVTQKTAWFMLHRIRTAMQAQSFVKLGGPESGPVEIDETFVGPKPQKMHRDKREARRLGIKARDSIAVMGMPDRELREVRAKVIPDVLREILQREILDQVEGKSTIYTDGWPGYDRPADRYGPFYAGSIAD